MQVSAAGGDGGGFNQASQGGFGRRQVEVVVP